MSAPQGVRRVTLRARSRNGSQEWGPDQRVYVPGWDSNSDRGRGTWCHLVHLSARDQGLCQGPPTRSCPLVSGLWPHVRWHPVSTGSRPTPVQYQHVGLHQGGTSDFQDRRAGTSWQPVQFTPASAWRDRGDDPESGGLHILSATSPQRGERRLPLTSCPQRSRPRAWTQNEKGSAEDQEDHVVNEGRQNQSHEVSEHHCADNNQHPTQPSWITAQEQDNTEDDECGSREDPICPKQPRADIPEDHFKGRPRDTDRADDDPRRCASDRERRGSIGYDSEDPTIGDLTH